ncbi:MAG: TIGR04086 family membrane protein [Ruminococcaceae bacterium]|nr:TIGR04086 family membrane protein [Oscillospiraceae bacterium]
MNTSFLKNCVKGFVAAILASVLLIFTFGYFCYTSKDPDSLINLLSMITLYAGAFIGGFVASRFNREMGLLSGLATGGLFMFFVLVLSLILNDGNGETTFLKWVMFFLVALASAVGGYLGVPNFKKRKKHKKKR